MDNLTRALRGELVILEDGRIIELNAEQIQQLKQAIAANNDIGILRCRIRELRNKIWDVPVERQDLMTHKIKAEKARLFKAQQKSKKLYNSISGYYKALMGKDMYPVNTKSNNDIWLNCL